MSAANIVDIVALKRRGDVLCRRGGYAAAAEKYCEAAVLAQRLPGIPDDNLVAVSLQLLRGSALISQAQQTTRLYGRDTEGQGFHDVAWSMLPPMIAALTRRMDAGTLLPGRCAALEEAWFGATSSEVRACSVHERAQLAKLVGLNTSITAAHEAFRATCNPGFEMMQPNAAKAELWAFVGRTLDMCYLQPPPEVAPQHVRLYSEQLLAGAMQTFFDGSEAGELERGYPYLDLVLQKLFDTWARVKASGALQRRGLLGCNVLLGDALEHRKIRDAAVEARTARRGLRSCALAGCGAKEAHVDHFKRCAACKTAVYCCRAHQLEAWPAHKKECNKAARKAAEAAP